MYDALRPLASTSEQKNVSLICDNIVTTYICDFSGETFKRF